MTPLNDDLRKRLTEFLGKCWHHFNDDPTSGTFTICEECLGYRHNLPVGDQCNRTFFDPDDWADLGAVKNKLVETGKWIGFMYFAAETYNKQYINRPVGINGNEVMIDFTEWLFTPPAFNGTMAEFLKQEVANA